MEGGVIVAHIISLKLYVIRRDCIHIAHFIFHYLLIFFFFGQKFIVAALNLAIQDHNLSMLLQNVT